WLGNIPVATYPIPKTKEKDPQRTCLVIASAKSKSVAYPNKWYHLAAVRKGNELTLYINGQPDGGSGKVEGTLGGDVEGDLKVVAATDKASSAEEIFE